jgi:peptidoglycan/LPS O-acetylase OafA/YrhL
MMAGARRRQASRPARDKVRETELDSSFRGLLRPGQVTLALMDRGGRLGYRPALDGLRGVAVLLVLAQHANVPFFAQGGTVGVTLFFVLSGFLITSILRDERATTGRTDFRGFYLRRARRLLPALALLLVGVTAYLLATGQSLVDVLLTAAYASNLAGASGHNLGNLVHTWTLSLEEQFYLLWPLLLPVVARRRRPALVLAVVAALVVAWRVVLSMSGASVERIYFGPDTRADAIVIGCALAFALASIPARHLRLAAAVSAAVLAGLCAAPPESALAWLLPPITLASLVVVAHAARSAPKLLTWRPLVATGRISYGLYLWSFPVALSVESRGLPVWVSAPTIAVVSVALALASWFVIERPFQRRPVKAAVDPVDPVVPGEVVPLTSEALPAR